ncbi:MAG: helix-turn-helix domain-containing protein [Chloroflexota bacterium]|nr:helix-turn-helix domain-containing protein [Chloroflexota bacterium]
MSGGRIQLDWQEDEQTLYELYRQETDHQDRTRLQALWLLRQGRTQEEVAEVVGFSARTVRRWVAWYREGGLEEVLQHRHGGHGGPEPKLTPEQEQALKEESRKGTFRTIWDGVEWVKEKFDVEYTYWGIAKHAYGERWIFDRLDFPSVAGQGRRRPPPDGAPGL